MRRSSRCFPVVVVAALFLAASAASADPLAVRYYEDAVSRFNSGDTSGALIQLKNSLQRDPAQLPARILMGEVQLEMGNPVQAEEEFLMAGQLGADPSLIILPLVRTRNQLEKYEQVIEQLRPNEYPPPVQPDLWVELGKARLGNGDEFGAEIAFNEALKLVPKHAESKLGRARIRVQQGKYAEAEELITDTLSEHPEDADAWFLMGSSYHARGELSGAVTHYRRARELDSSHYGAQLGEATALMDAGTYEEAASLFQELLNERPGSLKVGYLYARTLVLLGREAEAKAVIREMSGVVHEVPPSDLGDNAEHLLLAAIITFESGDYESAYRFLDSYRQYDSGNAWAGRLLASVLLKMGKPDEASRVLGRLLATHPKDPELLIMLGDVHVELANYSRAEGYYRMALEVVENDSSLIGRIGVLQYRRGETLQAIETLQGLVDGPALSGRDSSLFLAILYAREGRFQEAGELLDRIVEESPGNLLALNTRAVIAIAQGRRAEGRRILGEVLRNDAQFRPARLNLVKLDITEGRYGDAYRWLKGALVRDSADIQALHGLAELALAQNAREEATQYLETIRNLDPKALAPIRDLSNLYLAGGRKDKALEVADGLATNMPRSVPAQVSLARIQLARGEGEDARHTLYKARKLAGNSPNALLGISLLLIRANDLAAARESLELVVQGRPDWVAARVHLAHLLFRQRQFGPAEQQLELVLKEDPDNVQAITLLGDIRIFEGRAEEAVSLYERARNLSDIPDIAIRQYRALKTAGKQRQALQGLQKWLDENPDTAEVMRVLAVTYYEEGDLDAAQALYERLVELNPGDALAHNNLASILEASDTERALKSAMRAHELAPENAAILDTLGWMLVQLGELEQALSYLREAAARDSRSAEIRYHLGVALAEYGKTRDARSELERALALDPGFREAQDARDRLQAMGL